MAKNNPMDLVEICVRVIASHHQVCLGKIGDNKDIYLRPELHFTILHQIFKCGEDDFAHCLCEKLKNLRTFCQFLSLGHKHVELHRLVSGIINELGSSAILEILSGKMVSQLQTSRTKSDIRDAMALAGFLSESGWYWYAAMILREVISFLESLQLEDDQEELHCRIWILESTALLVNVLSNDCKFAQAKSLVDKITGDLETPRMSPALTKILPGQHIALANFWYQKSNFDAALRHATDAVRNLTNDLPPKVVVDVLRMASRIYVVKQQYAKAAKMIRTSVIIAMETWGESHPKTADVLVDYGFYLMNIDDVEKSQQVYTKACNIRDKIFGQNNLLTALIHEDVGYATYVHEYNYGYFTGAKKHASKAIDIMKWLLPENHLLIASGKRVMALILEEMAVDLQDKEAGSSILLQAEALHLSALELCVANLGEMNIQSAKHYGNLGRLYQSMQKPDKAEAMHLKAIRIKESLLGKEDYEVSLSLGHLASLYNYDMNLYHKAVPLYERSIAIGKRLFGPGYSGLEYDYRGLIRIYEAQGDFDMSVVYRMRLEDWKDLRYHLLHETNEEAVSDDPEPLQDVVDAVISDKETKDNKNDRWMLDYLHKN